MGISKVIGSAATVLFVASVYLKKSGMTFIAIPLLVGSLLAYLVTIASHPAVNFPSILGKGSDGSFPLWSKLLFGPFLMFVRAYVLFRKLKSAEPVYNEISDGLYVGGWPSSPNHLPPGEPAVIDCTCELPRSSFVSKDAYLNIATWDTRSPQPLQIEYAVHWACKKRAHKKPIYIHCAFGHGRSVCIMCALLVALGVADDWKDAEKMVKEKRPRIRMNAHHRKNLEEWTKYRHLSKGE
ncbi:uncharacterized protein YnbD-like [Phoenix dactylifera]|uniref:Uncharacterized protein YnbD-like n=1 Tax=Phoenix dactylifera TaxID=42345 RepID=A0A8B8J470_PHODC|nr:uncharacterized protein YnbD-like [Phoenix dactylifera]XP_008787900.1 uncharacterized protein YnbD-like [Phoenix dactylifera]XP_008787909.1 uncharacterized protein YnbD-like [Phoenix dactylifera]XP_026660157.1 uncharacterized protein YnbD-like [Phoenix dactylifera]